MVASALPPPPTPAADDGTSSAGWRTQQPEPPPPAQTGWPTTPAEIPLDGRHAFPEEELAPEPPAPPHRHSRNPVDRLTGRLPDPPG